MIWGEFSEKSAEGVGNTKGIANLARSLQVEMPLTFALERILFEKADIKEEIEEAYNELKVELSVPLHRAIQCCITEAFSGILFTYILREILRSVKNG